MVGVYNLTEYIIALSNQNCNRVSQSLAIVSHNSLLCVLNIITTVSLLKIVIHIYVTDPQQFALIAARLLEFRASIRARVGLDFGNSV